MLIKRYFHSGVVIFAGVLGIAAGSVNPAHDLTRVRRKPDLRPSLLRRFLHDNHCPDEEYAGMFVAEADTHSLDWRLLPSLSFVESGGGRWARTNNLFGWANGKIGFRTYGESIHEAATALSGARAYKGKSTQAKLAAFNQERPDYTALVMNVMRRIAPSPQTQPAR